MSNFATVVVEPRSLVREALKSLIAKSSYRVVCDAGAAAQISAASVSEEPKVVILGAPQSAESALSEAVAIRKLWPDSKIILLHERVSYADFQKLLASEINGCVPLFASSDTLVRTLNTIVTGKSRIMIAYHAKFPPPQPAELDKPQSDAAQDEAVPDGIRAMHTRSPVRGASTPSNLSNNDQGFSPAVREHPKLTEREVQILNGLVKGHANKVIARTSDMSEATVKVHIKSILRKIRVANRTQAAIWALENGSRARLETDLDEPVAIRSSRSGSASLIST
jgi:two-component system nitrate/nitrite response regulator NarL